MHPHYGYMETASSETIKKFLGKMRNWTLFFWWKLNQEMSPSVRENWNQIWTKFFFRSHIIKLCNTFWKEKTLRSIVWTLFSLSIPDIYFLISVKEVIIIFRWQWINLQNPILNHLISNRFTQNFEQLLFFFIMFEGSSDMAYIKILFS